MARRKVYFSARLDFPSSPLSAPGSPRMDLPGIQCFNPLSWQTTLYLFVIYPGKVKHEPEIMTTWISNIGTAFFSPLLMLRLNCDNLFCTYFLQRCLLRAHNDFFLQNNCSKEHLLPRNFWFPRKAKHFWITDLFVYDNWNFSTKLSCDFRRLWCSHFITKILLTKTHSNFFVLHVPTKMVTLFARKVIANFRFYYIHFEITGDPCNLLALIDVIYSQITSFPLER